MQLKLILILTLTGIWFFFIVWRVVNIFLTYRAVELRTLCKLIILMGDQDETAEWFLRGLMAWRNKLRPRLEVAVADFDSRDETGKIINILAGKLNYTVIDKESLPQLADLEERRTATKEAPVQIFDVRGLKGKNLLKTIPLVISCIKCQAPFGKY